MVSRSIPQRRSERRRQSTPRSIRSRIDRHESDIARHFETIPEYRTGNKTTNGRIGYIGTTMQSHPFVSIGDRRESGGREIGHTTETTI